MFPLLLVVLVRSWWRCDWPTMAKSHGTDGVGGARKAMQSVGRLVGSDRMYLIERKSFRFNTRILLLSEEVAMLQGYGSSVSLVVTGPSTGGVSQTGF